MLKDACLLVDINLPIEELKKKKKEEGPIQKYNNCKGRIGLIY